MPIAQMRNEIALVYPGERWQNRVSRMPENQVVAIYRSFQRTGRFDGKKTRSGKVTGELIPIPVEKPSPYHQMTIEEWMRGE